MLQRKYKQLDSNCNFYFRVYFFMFNRDKSSFANLVPRYFSLVNLNMKKGPLHVYRWFSSYVIADMLVDGKQKIAH